MAKYRKIDTAPGRENRQVSRLRKMIREERSARRANSTEVGSGGSLLVNGILSVIGLFDLKGTLSMKSDTGAELVRLGDMPQGDRGFQVNREDGSAALLVRNKNPGDTVQSWALYDANGIEVLSEQQAFGGLHTPFLEMPFQPVATTPGTAVTCGPYGLERSTSSSSWETLFVHDGKRQNQGVDLKVAALCSDNTTACEVRAINVTAGTQLASFFTPQWTGVVSASSPAAPAWIVLDPNVAETMLIEFATHAPMRVGIQVRRTAGAGSITLSIIQAIGG